MADEPVVKNTIRDEFESNILKAYRCIGETVYSAVFNTGAPPQLEQEEIRYIEIGSDRIDLYGEFECFISSFEDVGKWNNDCYSSFSRLDVETKIQDWWKKELGL